MMPQFLKNRGAIKVQRGPMISYVLTGFKGPQKCRTSLRRVYRQQINLYCEGKKGKLLTIQIKAMVK